MTAGEERRESATQVTRAQSHGKSSQSIGARGEQIAADWLRAHGFELVARNWHCVYGELDLIALDGTEIVFVEVKSRRGSRMGTPEEAVTAAKQRHLIQSAQCYLAETAQDQQPYRIDVLAVDLAATGELLQVRHFRSCVSADF